MAVMKKTNLLQIQLNDLEDPSDYRTWEGVRHQHLMDVDRVELYWFDEAGQFCGAVYKDRDGNFQL